MQRTLLCLLASVSTVLTVRVGVVSGPGDEVSKEVYSSLGLEPITHRVRWWNSFDVAVAVCSLAKAGVQGLVIQHRLHVPTLAARMQLPVVSVGGEGVDILPDTSSLAADIIQQEKWNSFVFIYQTDTGADQLQKILRIFDGSIEAFWRTNGVEETLELLEHLPVTRLLLSTSESMADELVSELAALRRNFDIILLTPVAFVKKTVNAGSYRLIKFSIVDQESDTRKHDKKLSVIMNEDAGRVIQRLKVPYVFQKQLNCFNYSTNITKDILKQMIVEGMSGQIKFNSNGKRVGYKLNIYEELPFDLRKLGWWEDGTGLHLQKSSREPTSEAYQSEPQIRVTSVLMTPFLFKEPNGNLKGYVVDLLEELMAVVQRTYRLQLVKDGGYGRRVHNFWNGMIGELMRDEADIAVAPLTKTREREKVVDFSKSFMTVGLNVLLKRPDHVHHEGADPFTFLSVWSVELWMVVLVAVIVFGGASFVISHFVGAPDRVRALESKGTDNLSPCGSVWFTIASLLQRDTGIYPRSFPHRVWAVVWWTFCFFLAVGYISSLCSFFTHETITTTQSRKTSQEVIQDLLEKGTPDIGVVKSGSTIQFFLNSDIGVYHELGRYLEKNPDVVMDSYDAGAKRVRKSNGSYAFITESSSTQFHTSIEPCDVMASSIYLTTKSYAVALQKNSPYKEMMDHAVLVLMESGTLRRLYEKWWHNYSSVCQDPSMDILPKVYSKSLTLHEVSGVFYILIIVAIASIITALAQKYASANQITLD